jgi:hypothetical protein
MKKSIISLIILSLTVVFVLPFQGCGKYEEGPSFSLRTKKGRLCRSWSIEKYVDHHGHETAPIGNEGVFTYDRDGTLSWSDGYVSVTGSWEFDGTKENINTVLILSIEEKILRLTSSEFWTEDSNGDETHYKAE